MRRFSYFSTKRFNELLTGEAECKSNHDIYVKVIWVYASNQAKPVKESIIATVAEAQVHKHPSAICPFQRSGLWNLEAWRQKLSYRCRASLSGITLTRPCASAWSFNHHVVFLLFENSKPADLRVPLPPKMRRSSAAEAQLQCWWCFF